MYTIYTDLKYRLNEGDRVGSAITILWRYHESIREYFKNKPLRVFVRTEWWAHCVLYDECIEREKRVYIYAVTQILFKPSYTFCNTSKVAAEYDNFLSLFVLRYSIHAPRPTRGNIKCCSSRTLSTYLWGEILEIIGVRVTFARAVIHVISMKPCLHTLAVRAVHQHR